MVEAYHFICRHPDMLVGWVIDHLIISLIAMAIATILGCLLGVFVTGRGRERIVDLKSNNKLGTACV